MRARHAPLRFVCLWLTVKQVIAFWRTHGPAWRCFFQQGNINPPDFLFFTRHSPMRGISIGPLGTHRRLTLFVSSNSNVSSRSPRFPRDSHRHNISWHGDRYVRLSAPAQLMPSLCSSSDMQVYRTIPSTVWNGVSTKTPRSNSGDILVRDNRP